MGSLTISKYTELKVSLNGGPQAVPTSIVKSLEKVAIGRMSSSDWVHQNILDDDNDDKQLTEMFPELEEESDVELEPNTIQKESKKVTTRKEYTDLDVLFGRGGRGNHHKGNKRYRSLVNSHKEKYRKIKDKQAKTAIARSIVQKINSSGGRFLMYDKTKSKWMEVPSVRARTKVSQALRE